MSIYLTSDTHFNHTNICGPKISKWESGYRNFDSLKQMEDTIVDNINAVVEENDILYHLGDVIMGADVINELPRILNRLKCRTIHHIYGNHANAIRKSNELQSLFTTNQEYIELRYKGYLIVMNHYPVASWHDLHHGSLHAFGHTHGTYIPVGRAMDVGVDCLSFAPIALEDFIDILSAKEICEVDHHKIGIN